LAQINKIYNHSIETDVANWDHSPHPLEYRQAWFDDLKRQGMPILVARGRMDGRVLCVGNLGLFKTKTGFARTVENSIYCHEAFTGMGLGTAMLDALIIKAREMGMYTMIAGIGAETVGSMRLHERFGFVEVARLKRVGWKFDRWHDLVYMQLMLD
jgi:L-amino acid N-acyltransferase YncA